MNYRHAFHAGNHADVLKHTVLCLIPAQLRLKEKPFFVLDTHAGRGLYDLAGDEGTRSAEHLGGVARILGAADAPAALQPYRAAVAAENPFGDLRWYPGSPAIARAALRADDRLTVCELHPAERLALEARIGGDPRVRIDPRDGYEAVRALLPPPARRGLVLIDPPFEAQGEFDRLAGALRDGMRRWASGVFMLWHPVKDAAGLQGFLAAAALLEPPKTLHAELYVRAPDLGRLSGSGLYILNPTFGLAEALREALPFLARRLQAGPGAGWRLVLREGDKVVAEACERLD